MSIQFGGYWIATTPAAHVYKVPLDPEMTEETFIATLKKLRDQKELQSFFEVPEDTKLTLTVVPWIDCGKFDTLDWSTIVVEIRRNDFCVGELDKIMPSKLADLEHEPDCPFCSGTDIISCPACFGNGSLRCAWDADYMNYISSELDACGIHAVIETTQDATGTYLILRRDDDDWCYDDEDEYDSWPDDEEDEDDEGENEPGDEREEEDDE